MSKQENRASTPDNPPVIRFGGPGGRGGPGGGGPMAARMNAEKPKNTKKTLVRLLQYIGKSKAVVLVLLGIMLAVTAADLLGPFFQAKAIDTFSVDPVTGWLTVDMQSLQVYLVVMAVVFIFSSALSFFQGILSARLAQQTVQVMRSDLFRKISRLPISYTDRHRHGDIMSRMTNDVENVSNAISQSVTTLFSCVIMLVGALVMMMYYSWQMTLIAIVTIPLSIFISSALGKLMRKHFVRRQKLLGQLNGQVEETVTSYKTVVAYGKEEESVEKFGAISHELRSCAIRARVWGSIMGPIMNFVGNLQYVLIAATGGWMVINGVVNHLTGQLISVGSVQAMLQYSKKFTHPINQIANQYSGILTALAGAERIFEIMDQADEIDEGTRKICTDEVCGEIVFRDVHFGYLPDEPVLKGLDLTVRPGQKIAIVGATGSGKTTVVNLLTRFYETDSGSITVDGVDIREIPKADLRRMIAIVLQDTVLFKDTIANNVKYGRADASDERMHNAARVARADHFIDRLPDGYATMLAEGGSNLSQGQRQLLAIARAVLADPKILILDEATSNVDTRTEMHIQQAMVALMKNRTSLIIAHRLSTIQDADAIVVIKNGRVAEMGDHETLLRLGGEYAQLYSNQFAGVAT
ncbi:MAG: ABC transporter ATP-binding protein [Clostridia bacterium]|nr:ABC transporter ATP-binding protein [Clostridia bacterium]